MEVIYRLADDLSAKSGMQESFLRSDVSGLGLSHGLICSDEWWSNIQSGALETHTVRGLIRGIWFGQYHDGPAQFQMQLLDGTLFGGHCYLEPGDADRAFTLGRIAEVDYVNHRFKTAPNSNESFRAVWLEIRLGETSPTPVSPLPFTEENFGRFTQLREIESPQTRQLEVKKPWWAFWR
jgi:hypothetical protein